MEQGACLRARSVVRRRLFAEARQDAAVFAPARGVCANKFAGGGEELAVLSRCRQAPVTDPSDPSCVRIDAVSVDVREVTV